MCNRPASHNKLLEKPHWCSCNNNVSLQCNVSQFADDLPDREASLIKKEYCRCGPHPLQVTFPSRARPPLVKGAGHIGPLFPEFRGWPLWFMASIALVGGTGILPKAALAVPGGPWVWSLGLFSSIFFLHIHKQKKKKKKKIDQEGVL